MRISIALLLQMVALFFANITVAKGGYDIVLTLSLLFTCLASLLLIQPFRLGGFVRRIICLLIAFPSLFVFAEFLGRVSFLR